MRRSTLIGRFLLVVMVVVALTGTSPAAPAQALAGPDYAIAWNGTVAPRSMPIPGLAGGTFNTVVASFRLWIPSGGTWHVESSATVTGVSKAVAPGSTYGRVGVSNTLECGPGQRDASGRLTTRGLLSVTGRNVLYDQTRTMLARNLWPAFRGYNRCQAVITVARDDLAVAGKRITLNSGYVRLIGRGLDNPASVTLFGHPQTATLGMPSVRWLGPSSPTITSPNFQIAGYVAPPKIAIAGNAAVSANVDHLDAIGDGFITTCYPPVRVRALPPAAVSIDHRHRPYVRDLLVVCPRSTVQRQRNAVSPNLQPLADPEHLRRGSPCGDTQPRVRRDRPGLHEPHLSRQALYQVAQRQYLLRRTKPSFAHFDPTHHVLTQLPERG
jgi:hypothetical protein